jgi:hypothetical protein
MQFISHRINTRAQLEATPNHFGVEIDLRSYGSDLVLHHDPFERGELLDDWLTAFNHKTLILNVKEEGLEPYLIQRMADIGCEDYFFLDQSFPFLVRFAQAAKGRSAVRFSEFESIDTVLALAGKVDWVWVDCFTRLPLDEESAARLKVAGFKLCLVSPELQGRDAEVAIADMRAEVGALGLRPDAICTKRADLWEEIIG